MQSWLDGLARVALKMKEAIQAVRVRTQRCNRFCNGPRDAGSARRESIFATRGRAHRRWSSCGLTVPRDDGIAKPEHLPEMAAAWITGITGLIRRPATSVRLTGCTWGPGGSVILLGGQLVPPREQCTPSAAVQDDSTDALISESIAYPDQRYTARSQIKADERLTTGTKRACPLNFGRLGGKLSEQSSVRWGGDVLGSIVRSPDESGICLDRPHVYP
jgi:hypothetical protein